MRLRINNICLWTIVYGLWTIIAGCGYTTRTILPDNVKTIYVDIFRNNIDITKEPSAKDRYEIYRPNLEVELTDAIIDRLFLDGHLKLMDKDMADVILEGEVVEYRKEPLRYQDEDVREYRISLVCNVRLKRHKSSEILLEENGIIGDATYFTVGSLQKSETQALKDAMSDISRRIVNRIIEDW